jgi:hypothetical protein
VGIIGSSEKQRLSKASYYNYFIIMNYFALNPSVAFSTAKTAKTQASQSPMALPLILQSICLLIQLFLWLSPTALKTIITSCWSTILHFKHRNSQLIWSIRAQSYKIHPIYRPTHSLCFHCQNRFKLNMFQKKKVS